MNDNNEKINNANRLAYSLYQRKDDEGTIDQLAKILNYLPEQLKVDMKDLFECLSQNQEQNK